MSQLQTRRGAGVNRHDSTHAVGTDSPRVINDDKPRGEPCWARLVLGLSVATGKSVAEKTPRRHGEGARCQWGRCARSRAGF